MALIEQLDAITQEYVIPALKDNVFKKEGTVFDRIKKKVDGGTEIRVPLLYDTGTVGTYQGYDVLDTSPKTIITAATYQFKQYYANMTLSGIERAKNSGKAAIIKYVDSLSKVAIKSLRRKLQIDIWRGNRTDDTDIANGVAAVGSADRLDGLNFVTDTGHASTSYGGITSTLMSTWKPKLTNVSGTFSFDDFDSMVTAITMDGATPKAAYTNKYVFNSIRKKLRPGEQYTGGGKQETGGTSFIVSGVPVYADPYIEGTGVGTQDSEIYILPDDSIEIRVMSSGNFEATEWMRPSNQDALIKQITVYLNLITDNRRAVGRLYNIDPA